MDHVATIWLLFLIPFAVIAIAGSWLAHYADAIARHWGVGGKWIGLILLATVTSIPEVVTGVAAVVWVEAVDLAVGSALGSCVFNLAILVLLDLASRDRSVYQRVREVHPVSARYGMLLLGLVGLTLISSTLGGSLAFGWIGLSTLLVFALYFWAIRRIQLFERERGAGRIGEPVESGPPPELTARQAATRYGAVAVVVIAAASNQLPSAALGAAGGGPLAVDATDPEGLRTPEAVFQLELGLLEEAGARIGERVYVRFDHGSEPLALRAFRALRRLLLRHVVV